ncbi:hypothetical protein GCM10009550_24550 [Actinocorallia libanotica]|uniref:Secreted protein n=1 Tax=Actinocorallia libanotica TaxID=46162 RepID=A0ABP4BAB9_9ACTN
MAVLAGLQVLSVQVDAVDVLDPPRGARPQQHEQQGEHRGRPEHDQDGPNPPVPDRFVFFAGRGSGGRRGAGGFAHI